MDLFSTPIRSPKTVGHGNGQFLADLANGMSRADLVARHRQGLYPDLWKGAAAWLKFRGAA